MVFTPLRSASPPFHGGVQQQTYRTGDKKSFWQVCQNTKIKLNRVVRVVFILFVAPTGAQEPLNY